MCPKKLFLMLSLMPIWLFKLLWPNILYITRSPTKYWGNFEVSQNGQLDLSVKS